MARRDAILRMHKTLLSRAEALRQTLAGELEDLRGSKQRDSAGDAADAAFDSGNEVVASQLAELEARELNQIEKALARIRQGSYGQCEYCAQKIPVARLNALPYSTTCVKCQREMEDNPNWDDRSDRDWGKISDASDDQPEINLSQIELGLSQR